MPVAIDVTPKDWTEISVLYDDGMYSVIWGRFRLNRIKSLGVRWNGAEGEKGYPSFGKYPLWYREPEFLIMPILRGLLEKHQGATPTPQTATYIKRAETALREAESQGTGVHGLAVLM